MKNTLVFIGLAIILMGAIAIVLFVQLFTGTPKPVDTQTEPFPTDIPTRPVDISERPNYGTSTGSESTSTAPLVATSSSVSFDRERIKAQSTYLGGGGSYEVSQTEQYSLYYDDKDLYMQITIKKRPLGEARLAGEKALLEATGLTEEELCRANVRVVAPLILDDKQQEFGLSFCPGSVDLTWQ